MSQIKCLEHSKSSFIEGFGHTCNMLNNMLYDMEQFFSPEIQLTGWPRDQPDYAPTWSGQQIREKNESRTPHEKCISWCPTFRVRLKYVKSDCTWFKLSRIMHQNTWSSCATMIHHHMAVCKQPCDLWTWIAQAFLQRFCNGTGFLVGSHPHKQPFQLCQVPYLQVVRIWVLEGAH